MKILVLDHLGIMSNEISEILKPLKENNHEIVFDNLSGDIEFINKHIVDCDVIVTANRPIGRELLEKAKKLKLISVAFTGYDHIDIEYCNQNKIIICNAAEYSTNSVAELTIGLIVSLTRNLIMCDTAARTGKTRQGLLGEEIQGKKVGIIGTGSIGLRVAAILNIFGCDLYAFSRSVRSEAEEIGVKYLSLENLMKTCDIISIHCPLNEETKNLIGKNEIALMKKNAYLINTGRGEIVDNIALAEALLRKSIAGAGLDVFHQEPPLPVDHPILYAPNTVIAPHVGFFTNQALIKRARIAFENIFNWIKGDITNQVS